MMVGRKEIRPMATKTKKTGAHFTCMNWKMLPVPSTHFMFIDSEIYSVWDAVEVNKKINQVITMNLES